ncbi:MAG TPA: hypothetical protein DDY78_01735 [Planctomycetales bacterium]|jgi:hypothetical protein|nr:hypothetical protein [Planctomycetales bacterium]
MSSNFPAFEFLMVNAARIPLFIVYIVGFVLALTTWRRHPRASLLSLIAFVLFFLAYLLAAGLNWYVLSMHSGMAAGLWLTAGNFVFTVIIVVAWGLILFALFARRPGQPDWSADERERYPRQYPERDVPSGPPSQDIRK